MMLLLRLWKQWLNVYKNQQGLINHNSRENDEFRALERFQRNNPPTFKGRHDRDGSQTWLKKIEKIFKVMAFLEEQKVHFGTHMLEEEAEDRWNNARQRLESVGIEIT